MLRYLLSSTTQKIKVALGIWLGQVDLQIGANVLNIDSTVISRRVQNQSDVIRFYWKFSVRFKRKERGEINILPCYEVKISESPVCLNLFCELRRIIFTFLDDIIHHE